MVLERPTEIEERWTMSKEELEAAFLADLQALLDKNGASLFSGMIFALL